MRGAAWLLAACGAFSAAAYAAPAAAQPYGDPTLAADGRTEFLHAWHAYERHAWGHDELRPLSRSAKDWYAHSLLMTPVDALDTLILMRHVPEADRARKLIDE